MNRSLLEISVIKMAGFTPDLRWHHRITGLLWPESCDKEASLYILLSYQPNVLFD
jgi:hypothetical protein